MQEAVEIGVIGGTGVSAMEGLEEARTLSLDTPFGAPSSDVVVGRIAGRRVAFLSRHGAHHALLPSEIPYRANVYALKLLGVSKAFGLSAVGSLRERLAPRSLIVPDQFLDRTRHRADTFFGDGIVAHVSMADPFSGALRHTLVDAAHDLGLEVEDGGTYLCMEGPQFSTRAESGFYRLVGCHVIGMTAYTEARLFREAEIAYASLNLVTDYDAWRPEEPGAHFGEIAGVVRENAERGQAVVRRAIERVPRGPLPENSALDHALVTPLARVPPATRERLRAILGARLADL